MDCFFSPLEDGKTVHFSHHLFINLHFTGRAHCSRSLTTLPQQLPGVPPPPRTPSQPLGPSFPAPAMPQAGDQSPWSHVMDLVCSSVPSPITPCLCSLLGCKHCYDGRTSSSLGTQHRCTPSWLQNMISKCHRVCHWALLSRQPSSPLLRHQVSSPIQLFRSGRSATFCCQPAISMTPFLLQDRLNINTAICILGRVGGGWGGRHNPFLIY